LSFARSKRGWKQGADGVFQALVIGLYPSFVLFPFHLDKAHKAAALNLTQARAEAREMGDERRTEIRKRVQNMRSSQNCGDPAPSTPQPGVESENVD
jgi:hypothetical protein